MLAGCAGLQVVSCANSSQNGLMRRARAAQRDEPVSRHEGFDERAVGEAARHAVLAHVVVVRVTRVVDAVDVLEALRGVG